MPAGRTKKIEIPDLIAKFKEKNRNREPRDPEELVKFSKKLRGFQEISFGEARKYFSQTPRRRGRPRPKQPETKEPEEKQSSQGPSSPQSQENATEGDEAAEAAPSYQIGDQVVLTKDRSGVIQFIGPVDFKEGTIYGIELHARYVGKCDGSRDGRRYFECAPKRGIFVQDSSIRRKMTKSDHARKDSWLAANRSSRVGRTPSPGPPTIAEEDQPEQPPEIELDEPATEEKEPSQDVPDEEDAGSDEDETNVEDEQPDDAEPPPPADENDVNEDDEVVDEAGVQVEEKVNGDYDEREVKEEESDSPVPPPEDSANEIVSAEEPEAQMPSQFEETDGEYYPAKPDENLLQFVAYQPDLRLRSQLMDHYMTSSDVERLERAFEHLKSFAPDEQNNLLRADIMQRLRDCR